MAHKKKKLHKTLVEQILSQHKIPYQQIIFNTYQAGDVAQLDTNGSDYPEHQIYKTLALTGKQTGPIVGVVPLDTRLSYKKIAQVSGNKKVGLIPLKELEATTTYEHGANTPIGIYEKKGYPIYFDNSAKEQGDIIVSSGQIGRSVRVNATQIAELVHGHFADLTE
ncbi:Cys-tRNA(Pro) deacylase [Fructilactobacillus myrtifloralis]|uniref:Cys-tRNA(Pro)/Cys-tRNA(Cys) deacylase n=1 Tax=Fructilactobacillus myrtifloralis TaxID=2940301 RepID=A0ABY5BLT2_9LACO|nr:YbaK/EbsC family protein [Fructilactobacillus myrtifloralis]USS84515.1 Cys-tRNA(Pro) deacylase [Fructilactobacillus myrtifloralis]